MKKHIKKAMREKFKEDGGFDGRFIPRVEKNKENEKEKYLCREKIDPKEIDEDNLEDIDIVPQQSSEDLPSEYNEEVKFNPFQFNE